MDFKTLAESLNLENKRVLVRVDWNVPIENGVVTDDYRIQKSLPTIKFLQEAGAKVTLISHLESETDSMRPVFEYVKGILPSLTFVEPSDLVLLENLRQNPGEKANSRDFAQSLAEGKDMYVNEAFSASHREHASIVTLPKLLPAFAGLQFTEEVKELSKAFYPRHPFLFILGGAKFDTKIPLIKRFITVADSIFVGGALAHNFFKVEGIDIKNSLVSDGDFELQPIIDSGRILLPSDPLWRDDKIVDAGMKDITTLEEKISRAAYVLWNGPLGNYEQGYKEGTLALARILAESGKEVIVGGGDTLAAIKELDLFKKFSFVSTGGGAMLDFLATGTLPGIEALKKI
jgi:phosphoglycerate kinase